MSHMLYFPVNDALFKKDKHLGIYFWLKFCASYDNNTNYILKENAYIVSKSYTKYNKLERHAVTRQINSLIETGLITFEKDRYIFTQDPTSFTTVSSTIMQELILGGDYFIPLCYIVLSYYKGLTASQGHSFKTNPTALLKKMGWTSIKKDKIEQIKMTLEYLSSINLISYTEETTPRGCSYVIENIAKNPPRNFTPLRPPEEIMALITD